MWLQNDPFISFQNHKSSFFSLDVYTVIKISLIYITQASEYYHFLSL